MSDEKAVIPQCLNCGACCASDDPKWVEVTEEDAKLINPKMLQDGDIEKYAMKMRSGNRCIALNSNNHCSIYSNRPKACRDFERGNLMCLYMLGIHGRKIEFIGDPHE